MHARRLRITLFYGLLKRMVMIPIEVAVVHSVSHVSLPGVTTGMFAVLLGILLTAQVYERAGSLAKWWK